MNKIETKESVTPDSKANSILSTLSEKLYKSNLTDINAMHTRISALEKRQTEMEKEDEELKFNKKDISNEFYIYKQSTEATLEDYKRKIEYNFRKVVAHENSLAERKDQIRNCARSIEALEKNLELRFDTRLDGQRALIQAIEMELEKGRDAWSIARIHDYEKADVSALNALRKEMEDDYATKLQLKNLR